MATKDKGGSKSRKRAPARTLKQKRQTMKAKQAGGTTSGYAYGSMIRGGLHVRRRAAGMSGL